MSTPTPPVNPTQFTWTDPTTNVDGSAIGATEISGYQLGIRSTTAAGSVAGTYPIMAQVASATATNELLSALGTTLAPDTYAAAVQTLSSLNGNSSFSPEVTFSIVPPLPNPPTNFSVA